MARKTTRKEDDTRRVALRDDELPEKALADAEREADQLDIADAASILQYGTSAQQRISEFSEQVLTHVRVKNVGKVREHLANLLSKVKNLELPRTGKPRGLDRIPFLRRLRLSQDSLTNHYDRVIEKIDKLVPELNASSDLLLKDVAFFDGLYARNFEHLRELDAFLVVGDRKLEAWAARLAASTPSAANGGETDACVAEQQRDRLRQIEFLRKRLQHLRMARMVSLQLAPEIRLIQDDLKVLAVEAQHAVLTTVPLWKNQIVAAVAMLRQRETSRVAREATHATTEILSFNSDLIRDSTAQIAHRESEKRTVERDTLDKAGTDLEASTAALRTADPAAASAPAGLAVAQAVRVEAESAALTADAVEVKSATALAATAKAKSTSAPAVTANAESAATANAESAATANAKPAAVANAKPAAVAKSRPVGAANAKPAVVAKAKPVAAAKARPVGAAKARPAAAAKARPAAAAKAKPVGAAKAKPVAAAKARPAAAAKAKPAAADAAQAAPAATSVAARVAARTTRMTKGNGHGGSLKSPGPRSARSRVAKPVRPADSTT